MQDCSALVTCDMISCFEQHPHQADLAQQECILKFCGASECPLAVLLNLMVGWLRSEAVPVASTMREPLLTGLQLVEGLR